MSKSAFGKFKDWCFPFCCPPSHSEKKRRPQKTYELKALGIPLRSPAKSPPRAPAEALSSPQSSERPNCGAGFTPPETSASADWGRARFQVGLPEQFGGEGVKGNQQETIILARAINLGEKTLETMLVVFFPWENGGGVGIF